MRFLMICLAFLLSACDSGVGAPPVPAYQPEQLAGLRTRAVLVAAESSIKAFDNATARFATALTARGVAASDIHRFSAKDLAGTERSDISGVMRRIGTLEAGPNQACLIYMTGHGAKDMGIVFLHDDDYLDPKQLDRVLRLGCGVRPTVVVMSACFSGIFSGSAVARANRIIITAARRDRPSFGCGAGDVFTFFDDCFLKAFEDRSSLTWEAVAQGAFACVEKKEAAEDSPSSKPQIAVGAAVRGLRLPIIR